MNRREAIKKIGLAGTAFCFASLLNACNKTVPGTILLVSGWQEVNIGDIAHTPGLINILKTFLPEVEIILWEKAPAAEVEEMLHKYYPGMQILKGNIDDNSEVDNPLIYEAFDKSDLMIHGSGPYVVGQPHLEAWVKYTKNKPFGIFGTTIEKMNDKLKELLSKAAFIYTRETASLAVLKESGLSGDHISFAPDATFYFNLHDDVKAESFLLSAGLSKNEYICAVPRSRRTPYYKIRNRHKWTEKSIEEMEAYNFRLQQEDFPKLREALIWWVRKTGYKVLLCPEMTYQVDLMDDILEILPADVKPNVLKRGYWLPDEAASVYARSCIVVSFDCHSPIIAAANNVPFFYLRQPEDTIKGQMYYDLHFPDRVFEIEETTGQMIVDRLQEVWQNYSYAKQRITNEMETITQIYKSSCAEIASILQK